jgi:hypothetical protein
VAALVISVVRLRRLQSHIKEDILEFKVLTVTMEPLVEVADLKVSEVLVIVVDSTVANVNIHQAISTTVVIAAMLWKSTVYTAHVQEEVVATMAEEQVSQAAVAEDPPTQPICARVS